jgi:hypothetical protein
LFGSESSAPHCLLVLSSISVTSNWKSISSLSVVTALGALNGLPHLFPLFLGLRLGTVSSLLFHALSAICTEEEEDETTRQAKKMKKPTKTPQQKDKGELLVCVDWSLVVVLACLD